MDDGTRFACYVERMEFGIDLYSLSIIGLGLALGAFVKGLTGMGLPLVQSPSWRVFGCRTRHRGDADTGTGIQRVAGLEPPARGKGRAARYDMMLPAAMTVVGVWFLDVTDDRIIILPRHRGGILSVLTGIQPVVQAGWRHREDLHAYISMVGGFVQGAAGVSGPLFSTLIMSFRLPKEGYVFYNGLVFGLFNVVQIIAMLSLGIFHHPALFRRLYRPCSAVRFQFLGMRVMGYAAKVFTGAVVAVIVVMEIKLVWEG